MTARFCAPVFVITFATGIAFPAAAELLYQPPPPPPPPAASQVAPADEWDAAWRLAAAQLFASAATINDGLGKVELKKRDEAAQAFARAQGFLKAAADGYAKLERALQKPRSAQLEMLRADARGRLEQIRAKYGFTVPRNEREAASLARQECVRLEESLAKNAGLAARSDLGATRELLSGIERLQGIGTTTAELMATLADEKR